MAKSRKSRSRSARSQRSSRSAHVTGGKKQNSIRRYLTLLALLGLIAGGVCFAIFVVVNHRTLRILKARGTTQQTGIYSDSRTITSGQRLRPDLLRSELARRGYREVTGPVANPGEFAQIGPNFVVRTRTFISAEGTTSSSVLVRYNPETGAIAGDGPNSSASFSLEPQLITDLSSADIRASRFVSLSKIPPRIAHAIIAIEDERFYSHRGIDIIGIARAAFTNLRAMGLVQGGSTLTQQLAKNIFLTPRRTLGRKIMELFTALSLERELSKDQILEMYLNEVYLGQEGAVALHGVAEASRTFFGKDLSQITVAESALLAGIIKAPSNYSPRRHLARAIDRRNVVLSQMLSLGYISQREYDSALAERPQIKERTDPPRQAPHFTAALRRILSADYPLDPSAIPNLRIFTGIDSELQRCAERAVANGVLELEKHNRVLQRRTHKLEAGLVAIEPFSGKVRAWAGGRNFSDNQFDHVYLAKRPVGSTIKPFVYLTALDQSLNHYKVATASSILADEPITIQNPGAPDWSPSNYDHQFRGDVTLRYALEHSLNLPTVYLAQRIGLDAVAATIERFHLAKKVPAVPSLVLGTAETSLLDLVASYGALANGGVYVQPRSFVSAIDQDGALVAKASIAEERVAAEAPVFVLTNLLQGVVERGTATRVRSMGYRAEVAGKTGTTDEARDAWFVGFSPDLVAGVWVGFDDNKRVGLTGGVAAVPIWTEFMQCASQFREALPFIAPPNVVLAKIDSESGLIANSGCPRENITDEIFVQGTEPKEPCDLHLAENDGSPDSLSGSSAESTVEPKEAPRRQKTLWDTLFQ